MLQISPEGPGWRQSLSSPEAGTRWDLSEKNNFQVHQNKVPQPTLRLQRHPYLCNRHAVSEVSGGAWWSPLLN
jgi:hypothetical protein